MSEDLLDLDFLGDDFALAQQEETVIEDAGARGLKFSFLCTGQCGNNIASQLWEQGYRRVLLFNTTAKDALVNKVPQKWHIIADGYDGAGKNRGIGKEAAVHSSTRVLELMSERFRQTDFIFVVTSAGGGSGSGSAVVLAGLAKSYLMQSQGLSEAEAMQRVGVIAALPKQQEGSAVAKNARDFVSEFVDTETGKSRGYSPLIFIDNARSEKMLPKDISVTGVNPAINKVVMGLFDIFNTTSARHSDISTFDPKDYSSVLKSGIITIGLARLRRIDSDVDIARAIKSTLTNTLLVDNMDVGTGSHAGIVITAGDSLLDTISSASVNKTQEMMNALLSGGDSSKKVYLHLGVYRQTKENIDVLTLIGGLSFPLKRLESMA